MNDTIQVIFIVDSSGSMLGQKIAAVNASITECTAEIRQIAMSNDHDIKVSLFMASDHLTTSRVAVPAKEVMVEDIVVLPKKDGFYRATSFEQMYNSLRVYLQDDRLSDHNEGKNTCIILFSDCRPYDYTEAEQAYESLKTLDIFANAKKYVAAIGSRSLVSEKMSEMFTDFRKEQIISAGEMAREIGKNQIGFFTDALDNNNYDDIFA